MKIAVLSDIHSNLHALKAVMEDVTAMDVDMIVSLGDMVGYNAFPNEVLDILVQSDVKMILGNHDRAAVTGDVFGFNPVAIEGVRFSTKQLRAAHKDLLDGLPETLSLDIDGTKLDLFHGSPRQPLMEYVYPDDLPKVGPGFWDQTGADVILLGHTHLPAQHGAGNKFIGNPGSVGQPRDSDPRSSYAILDPKKRRLQFKRVAYDIEAAAEANLDAGLPEFLASRLIAGK